jgi:hypothetical protein
MSSYCLVVILADAFSDFAVEQMQELNELCRTESSKWKKSAEEYAGSVRKRQKVSLSCICHVPELRGQPDKQ